MQKPKMIKKKNQTVSKDIIESARNAGLDLKNTNSSGIYVFEDKQKIASGVYGDFKKDLIVMDIKEALNKYSWVKEHMWKLIDRNKDQYTKLAFENFTGGYFIWVKKGAKLSVPLQSCLVIKKNNFTQVVHNIIVVESGARVNILSGCFNHPNAHVSKHIGISEFYVKKGGYLNFTMIHNWQKDAFVRPRTAAVLEDGAEFVSNYVLLSSVKDIQSAPLITLKGKESKAALTSIIYGKDSSQIDLGGVLDLAGQNSQAYIVSRAIANDSSNIISRGLIKGVGEMSKGHLECQGLLLSDKSKISAIPELLAEKKGLLLSHEAAIGKISKEEIIYLMSRGLSQKKAEEVIVKGFLDVRILGLPSEFKEKIKVLVDSIENGF